MAVGDEPFWAAIAAAALKTRQEDIGERGSSSHGAAGAQGVFWPLWFVSSVSLAHSMFSRWIEKATYPHVIGCSLLMKDVYWHRQSELEPALLEAVIQTVPEALHPVILEEVQGKVQVPEKRMGRTQGRWLYHKLANLLEIIDGLEDGSPEAILAAVDAFAEDRWMKVAGGAKVTLLEAAYKGHVMTDHEIGVEFGTFIGYTAIRLASTKPLVTIEVDVVHAAVARRILKKARVNAEVWVGTVRDLLPRILDEYGEACAGFLFCDQRGTAFQEDLARLERLQVVAPDCCVVADNVLRPGAPVFLWATLHGALQNLKIWTVPEQGQEGDDWVVVGDNPHFLHCKALQSVPPVLTRVAWESDVMRGLAEEGGIQGADWAGFTEHVLQEYALLGLEAEPWPHENYVQKKEGEDESD